MPRNDENVIQEQIRYYDRRALEYDETSAPPDDPLAPQVQQIHRALDLFAPMGHVLELGCGTGTRTQWLLKHADTITALDSSEAMLRQAQEKVNDPRVRWVLADLFTWEPEKRYDVVFFAFWLSHVPLARFNEFWDSIARWLKPAGRVFLVDEGQHDHWREELVDPAVPLVRRCLEDGSEHRVVKVLWDAKQLEQRLRAIGWEMAVYSTGAFYWGEGSFDPSTASSD